MRKCLFVGLLLFAFAVPPAAARATIVFDICETATLCGQAQVNVTTQVDGAMNLAFNGVPYPNRSFFPDANGIVVGFNVAGPPITIASSWPPGFEIGPQNVELGPYGFFEYTLVSLPEAQTFDFITARRVNGVFFERPIDFFELNDAGFLFAAHLMDSSSGITGYVAFDDLPDVFSAPVPEPGTMILVGGGLAAMIARRRRRSP